MKKAFLILGILAVFIAAVSGAYYLGANADQNDGDQNDTDKSIEVPDDDGLPPFDGMIVGVWQNGPSVGAAIGECYRFYADGTYTFTPSPFVSDLEDYRPPRSEGTYRADEDSVTLLMTRKTVVEGGEWLEDPIMGYTLEGGTEKTVEASKTIFTIYLGKFKALDRHMLDIGGRTYWKLSGDPDDYLD